MSPKHWFEHKTIRTWDDLHTFVKEGRIFRGQRDAHWHLESSIERCALRNSIPPTQRPDFEQRLFREFRRTYHLYGAQPPSPDSLVEWLSLMQHHGGPTRLQDFTYSLYVAAYFATEQADTDSAVWSIDRRWLLAKATEQLKRTGKNGPALDTMRHRIPFEQDDEKNAAQLFLEAPFARACWPINAFRLNQRLVTQRGLFLTTGDITLSLEQNLLAIAGSDAKSNITKIVIPRRLRNEVIRKLFTMGVSRTTLFPGLDGFAQSLAVWHSAYEPNRWGDPPPSLPADRSRATL